MPKSEKKNRSGDCIGHNTSPNQEKRCNPSKKSRTDELQPAEILNTEMIPLSSMEVCNIPNVQSQVTVETVNTYQEINHFSRLDSIKPKIS